MEYVIQEDFILVTRNAQDFRGVSEKAKKRPVCANSRDCSRAISVAE